MVTMPVPRCHKIDAGVVRIERQAGEPDLVQQDFIFAVGFFKPTLRCKSRDAVPDRARRPRRGDERHF